MNPSFHNCNIEKVFQALFLCKAKQAGIEDAAVSVTDITDTADGRKHRKMREGMTDHSINGGGSYVKIYVEVG